jgi:methionine synthase I (cobalamin-dependent)
LFVCDCYHNNVDVQEFFETKKEQFKAMVHQATDRKKIEKITNSEEFKAVSEWAKKHAKDLARSAIGV